MTLSAINTIKKNIWILFSTLYDIHFFPSTLKTSALYTIKINLHPSRAGIGRRLKTQRLIDIIAVRMIRNITPAPRLEVIKSTIPIGPAKLSTASSLSTGVSGKNIF